MLFEFDCVIGLRRNAFLNAGPKEFGHFIHIGDERSVSESHSQREFIPVLLKRIRRMAKSHRRSQRVTDIPQVFQ